MTNWFKRLPFLNKMALVGSVSLLPMILLSPVIFIVGKLLVAVGVVAVTVNWLQRKSLRVWGTRTVVTVALTLAAGILSNLMYNTNNVWGIGYELSTQEQAYVDRITTIQGSLEDATYEQEYMIDDYLSEAYPDVSYDHGYIAGESMNISSDGLDAAEGVTVPTGCERHYNVWIDGVESAHWFVLETGAVVFAGSEEVVDERLSFARRARDDFESDFNESDRILRKIQRTGCDL